MKVIAPAFCDASFHARNSWPAFDHSAGSRYCTLPKVAGSFCSRCPVASLLIHELTSQGSHCAL